MGDGTSNAFKIVLITGGVLIFGAVVFIMSLTISSIFSDEKKDEEVANNLSVDERKRELEMESNTDDGTREQRKIDDNQANANDDESLNLRDLNLNGTRPNTDIDRARPPTDDGTGPPKDVLTYHDDGRLESNYSVNSDGGEWIMKYYSFDEFRTGFAEWSKEKLKGLNGRGEFTTYYYDGFKFHERRGVFKAGKLNGRGESTSYHYYGQERREGTFKDDELHGKGVHARHHRKAGNNDDSDPSFIGGLFNEDDFNVLGRKGSESKGIFNNGSLTEGSDTTYYHEGDGNKKEEKIYKPIPIIRAHTGNEIKMEESDHYHGSYTGYYENGIKRIEHKGVFEHKLMTNIDDGGGLITGTTIRYDEKGREINRTFRGQIYG